jgi:hypothetical protein
MKIECSTTFLDGAERFEAGDIRTVDDERGAYFVGNGWAKDVTGAVATGAETSGEITLEVQGAVMGQEANHG